MGRPSDSFDGRLVFIKFYEWLVEVEAPQDEFVVVSTRAQLLAVVAPFKPADLLLVRDELANVVRFAAYISMCDMPVSRPGCQNISVPGQRSDATRMPSELPNRLAFIRVP
jgi:hypothetical protein